ncbi:transposase Tn3 family protein [Parafrankia sp. EAN1pec]|uniref:Tn3 family transposase n=1 Tax=Parafrankia sp. (strain EAN1pec) TaxID=298653 RepID=UPI0000544AC5|nr:transposase Tn3 family protein [Frankia sp. EAN1pec]
MAIEYLSEEQVRRYGGFARDPSPGELEQSLRMDRATLALVASKRREANRLGWSVQWATVRMVGTFLTDPAEVPAVVAAFMAEQVGVVDPGCLKGYSTLEEMRTTVTAVSGRGLVGALDRVSSVWAVGTGGVEVAAVPPVKLAELAAYGMVTKATTIRGLHDDRKVATVLATVRHLEAVSVDDALLLFDILMATKLLARAERVSGTKRLKTLPRFRQAAGRVAAAITVLLDVPQARDGQVMTVAEMWTAIEQVVPREKLQAALVTVAEYLPDEAEDDDADWRTELVTRYATVTGFLELLAETIAWGATPAGAPIVAALRDLPRVKARRAPEAAHIGEHAGLVTGSWRRLVYANPQLSAPLIDKHAYVFCVLEHLHRALRRKDVYALGADRWGDPRARLLDGDAWEQARPRGLSALGLPEQPTDHLAELVCDLDAAYRQVSAGLPTNSAVQIEGGRIRLDRLAAAPDPAGMEAARDAVAALLPRVDYAELLLEVFERTGLPGAFTHISGSDARPADFDWGGGLVAGADRMRFVVPVRSIAARPSAKYFAGSKRRAGATWLNVVSDKVMGLGGLVVPGTPRDSLHILDALHNLDVDEPPEIITTDTGSYSDLVFGLFAISGYQFSPRIADLADTRLWRTRTDADYGPLNTVSGHTVNLARIVEHWQDMLRVAGSLITGEVRAHDMIRMLTREGNPTGLGNAFVAYGRLFKTLHVLQVLHDESYRRMISAQQNITEGRHSLARRIFFGNRGELRQRYQTGMEDQIGVLGLALNCVVLWNTWYIDAAVTALEAGGMTLSAEIRSRLSPLVFEHINFHGSYPFVRPGLAGDLRPLRNPTDTDEQ